MMNTGKILKIQVLVYICRNTIHCTNQVVSVAKVFAVSIKMQQSLRCTSDPYLSVCITTWTRLPSLVQHIHRTFFLRDRREYSRQNLIVCCLQRSQPGRAVSVESPHGGQPVLSGSPERSGRKKWLLAGQNGAVAHHCVWFTHGRLPS